MSNNPYSKGWADGHRGNPFNNPYPAESYRASEYYKGYQDGSRERNLDCLAASFNTFTQEEEFNNG